MKKKKKLIQDNCNDYESLFTNTGVIDETCNPNNQSSDLVQGGGIFGFGGIRSRVSFCGDLFSNSPAEFANSLDYESLEIIKNFEKDYFELMERNSLDANNLYISQFSNQLEKLVGKLNCYKIDSSSYAFSTKLDRIFKFQVALAEDYFIGHEDLEKSFINFLGYAVEELSERNSKSY